MNCIICGENIDGESNYCKHCGYNLDPVATNPHSTIFDNSYRRATQANADLGFLIILIIIAVNAFLWTFWSFINKSITSDYRANVMVLRLVGIVSLAAQLIVMFIFTKRQGYRTTIGITGAVLILYQIYSIIQTMAFLR